MDGYFSVLLALAGGVLGGVLVYSLAFGSGLRVVDRWVNRRMERRLTKALNRRGAKLDLARLTALLAKSPTELNAAWLQEQSKLLWGPLAAFVGIGLVILAGNWLWVGLIALGVCMLFVALMVSGKYYSGETKEIALTPAAAQLRQFLFKTVAQLPEVDRYVVLADVVRGRGPNTLPLLRYVRAALGERGGLPEELLRQLEAGADAKLAQFALAQRLHYPPEARAEWLKELSTDTAAHIGRLQTALAGLDAFTPSEQAVLLMAALRAYRYAPTLGGKARQLLIENPNRLAERQWMELIETSEGVVGRFAVLQLGRVAGASGAQLLEELVAHTEGPLYPAAWAAVLYHERFLPGVHRLFQPPHTPPNLRSADPDVTLLVLEAAPLYYQMRRPDDLIRLMLNAAGHSETRIRQALEVALAKLPPEELYPVVTEMKLNPQQTAAVLGALAKLPAYEPFRAWLGTYAVHPDEALRKLALEALVSAYPEAAVPHLLHAARHESLRSLRTYAHERLLESTDGRVIPYLLREVAQEKKEWSKLTGISPKFSRLGQGLFQDLPDVVGPRLLRALRDHHMAHDKLRAQSGLYCQRTRRRPRQVLIEGFTFLTVGPNDFDLRDVKTGVETVVGVIGDLPPAQAGTLYLPLWDEATKQAQPAEIDRLEVRPSAEVLSYDWAIAAVTGQLAHVTQLPQLRALPIEVYVPLSANALRQLESLHGPGPSPRVTLRVA